MNEEAIVDELKMFFKDLEGIAGFTPNERFLRIARDTAKRILKLPEALAIREATVPVLDAINEPCKGCGKRPIDFMVGE